MKNITLLIVLLLSGSISLAHHSYAPIDKTTVNSIKVTIALLQWTNPHIYIWGYVEDDSEESGYKLWGFQAGSITMMGRAGWTKDGTVEVGEEITIDYFPIKDGSAGGEILSMTHADGTVTDGDQPPKNWFRIMQENQNGEGL